MSDETLQDVINDIDSFKQESVEQVRQNINHEVAMYKQEIPKELDTSEFDLKIQEEVDQKLAKFNEDMDIKPTALYYSLKTEVELNDEITEQELTISAYDFLEKHTSNKLLKKILKELKKETKNA